MSAEIYNVKKHVRIDGRRICFAAIIAEDLTNYIVAVCVEHDSGYREVKDFPPGPKDDVYHHVNVLNEQLGLTDEDAVRITASTFPKRRQ